MNDRICICCGDPFALDVEARPDNPHVCASCEALAARLLEQSTLPPERPRPREQRHPAFGGAPDNPRG